MDIRMSVARCCCGSAVTYPCNPISTPYDPLTLYQDTDLTVSANKTGWTTASDAVSGATAPWLPAISWAGFFNSPRYPLGGSWEFFTILDGKVDFATSDDSYSFYGTTGSGNMYSRHSTTANSSTASAPLLEPCSNNTFNVSFTHSHVITSGWTDNPSFPGRRLSTPSTTVSVLEGSTTLYDVKVISGYNRFTGVFDNEVEVTTPTSTTSYPFGTSSTNSATLDIKLTVNAEDRANYANRWRISFDIDAGGTTLSIPDDVFDLSAGGVLNLSVESGYAANDGGTYDKYKVAGLSTSITNT